MINKRAYQLAAAAETWLSRPRQRQLHWSAAGLPRLPLMCLFLIEPSRKYFYGRECIGEKERDRGIHWEEKGRERGLPSVMSSSRHTLESIRPRHQQLNSKHPTHTKAHQGRKHQITLYLIVHEYISESLNKCIEMIGREIDNLNVCM